MERLEQLHKGTAIVIAKQAVRDEEILLCALLEDKATPFVSWQRKLGGNPEATFTGHYYTCLTEAYDCWKTRARLN